MLPSAVTSKQTIASYYLSRFFWVLASQINIVAVGWYIYEATHSALALGLVGLAAFVPRLILTLMAGVIADRFPRTLVASASLIFSGLASAVLALIVARDDVWMPAVYTFYIFIGAMRTFTAPAFQALLPNIVDESQLARSVTLSTIVLRVAAIIGPVTGGWLYYLGATAPFWGAATIYLVSGALIAWIPVKQDTKKGFGKRVRLRDAMEGIAFIAKNNVILSVMTLDLVVVLFGGVTTLLPMIASELLHSDSVGLGLLRCAQSAGALCAGVYLVRAPIESKVGPSILVAIAIFGAATIAIGMSTNLYITVGALLCLGAADMVSVVVRQSIVQHLTPDTSRGRVSAVNSLVVGASNELGGFESGLAAAAIGLAPSIIFGGCMTVLIACVWAMIFPRLRSSDGFARRPLNT